MADQLWLSGWSVPASVWDGVLPRIPGVRHLTWDWQQGSDHPVTHAERRLRSLRPPVTVIGWSLGAMVALELAQRHHQRINRLILIAATDRFTRNWHPRVLQRMKKELYRQPIQLLQSFDERLFAPGKPDEEWMQHIRGRDPLHTDRLVAGLEYLEHFRFSREQAALITQPVHLLHGFHDTICAPDDGRRLALQFPHAEWTLWETAGHIPFWTHPKRFQEWLERKVKG